ncbi:hypothetical protein GY45DRAFT_1375573 [Cubamyces sp. BRFM 1775]|nr:hypothetical protein GY45DRAFT_1375573 [Cubamyces sp. BRFM 1775]
MSLLLINNKPTCATLNCVKTQLAEACTRKKCARCCRAEPSSCGYSGHDSARARQAAAHTAAAHYREAAPTQAVDPFQLERPLPVKPPIDPSLTAQAVSPIPSQSPPPTPASVALPATPLLTPPDADKELPQRRLGATMDPRWKMQWDQDAARQAAHLEAEQQRRANEKALAHSVSIWWWRQDGQPQRHIVQSITTWPTFCLAQCPQILALLGIEASATIESYNILAWSWQTQLATGVFQVKSGTVLLLRQPGVTDCENIDHCILDAKGSLSLGVMSPLALSPLPSPSLLGSKAAGYDCAVSTPQRRPKRPIQSVDDYAQAPPAQAQRTQAHCMPHSLYNASCSGGGALCDIPPNLPAVWTSIRSPDSASTLTPSSSSATLPPPTPESANASPCNVHPDLAPSAPLPVGLGIEGSTSPAPFSAVFSTIPLGSQDILDNLWLQGHVHVPAHARQSWPNGMYARDMAKAFSFMAATGAGEASGLSLKKAFEQVFGSDVRFVMATAHRQFNAWRFSTQKEREALLHLARTPAGLWSAHRKGLSGWASANHHN